MSRLKSLANAAADAFADVGTATNRNIVPDRQPAYVKVSRAFLNTNPESR